MIKTSEPFRNVLSNIKNCSDITIECTQDEEDRYKLEQKLERVQNMPYIVSPLSFRLDYNKFFVKNEVGAKPVCKKTSGCGSKIKNGQYQKYVNDYADWKIENKMFRQVEIPIEMDAYKNLKKLDDIISGDLDQSKLILQNEITTTKQLTKLIETMIRAKAVFSKKKVIIIFKIKPTEANTFYWTQTNDSDRYLNIAELLKNNNIPLTTNHKC
jgi:hypothetical protein